MFDRDDDELMKPIEGPTSTGESIIDGLKDLVGRRGFWIGVAIFVLAVFLAAIDVLEGTVFLVGAAVLYFLPAVIARNKPNSSSVFIINLFLGWTLIMKTDRASSLLALVLEPFADGATCRWTGPIVYGFRRMG